MFDFRYHALSLAAVFLALGIGIVLGVTAGDSLVTEADRNIRDSLRGNVEDARQEARDARARLEGRDELIQSTFGALAGGRLRGRRVGVVGFDSLPEGVESPARRAIEDGDGALDSVTVFNADIDRKKLGGVLGGRFRRLADEDDLLPAAGRRVGRALVRGGRLAAALERAFPDEFDGDYRGIGAVTYFHQPEADPKLRPDEAPAAERARERADALERGLIAGLRGGGRSFVGVERSDTDPSQIEFYEQRKLSSVDSVDTVGGRLALVLALDGARGTFGFKPSADRPLPETASAGGGPAQPRGRRGQRRRRVRRGR